jgi:hypothetical protein
VVRCSARFRARLATELGCSAGTGTFVLLGSFDGTHCNAVVAGGRRTIGMNGVIYLVGLVVVIMAILSFFGLR